jgi:hypothetical protein
MRCACGNAQMVCYHVHVPLLLRLSNDVEENPGSRNITEIVDQIIRNINEIVYLIYTVHADFHQGDQLMFRSNAGKQCAAMSLCSIVYNVIKSVNICDTSITNQILVYGNNLYGVHAWLENEPVFGVDKDEDVIECAFVVLVLRDLFFPFSTLLLPVCE